jgi:hypothetical protein
MNAFEGLYIYEVILLVLGAILFTVLIVLLIFLILKNRSVKALIALFPLCIVMIGFAGIQKVRFDNGVVEIERTTQMLAQNPDDTEAKERLLEILPSVENRPVQSTSNLIALARAHEVMGDLIGAEMYTETVLSRDPASDAAIEMKKRIDLNRSITEYENNPGNTDVRRRLAEETRALEGSGMLEPSTLVTLVEARIALGDTATARNHADTLVSRDPRFESSLIQRDLRFRRSP